MAWVQQDPSGNYHVSFRFGGRKFKRSLHTENEEEALPRQDRLEETIRLILTVDMRFHSLGDFGFDGYLEHLLGALAKDLTQHVATCGWKRDTHSGNFWHNGILGRNRVWLTAKFKPEYAALFNSSSTTTGHISKCISASH